ncbi:MAG TPA: penicillin acylase family protein, partial [Bacteroidales bacterium]|nr:penicillin acylase family protein [Bacteroidales bacterium]
FDELPYSYNPESGYVASANNRTVGDDYPYYISRWFDLPNRFERIVEGLTAKEKLTVEDFKRIQSNQNSMWAQKLVPFFTSVMADKIRNEPGQAQKAYQLLQEWDYEMGTGSVPSTIFEQFYVEFLYAMFHDELGDELYNRLISQDLLAAYLIDKVRRTGKSVWFDNVNTPEKVETAGDIAITAIDSTVAKLQARLGNDMSQWEWGKVHTLTLKHPLGSVKILDRIFSLNRGPYSVGGSYHTVSPYSYPLNDLFHANHGSSHRHIYVAGDWDRSQVIIPTGISGIPASPYYCSQTESYLNYIYKTDYFSEEGVNNHKSYTMKFIAR